MTQEYRVEPLFFRFRIISLRSAQGIAKMLNARRGNPF